MSASLTARKAVHAKRQKTCFGAEPLAQFHSVFFCPPRSFRFLRFRSMTLQQGDRKSPGPQAMPAIKPAGLSKAVRAAMNPCNQVISWI